MDFDCDHIEDMKDLDKRINKTENAPMIENVWGMLIPEVPVLSVDLETYELKGGKQ